MLIVIRRISVRCCNLTLKALSTYVIKANNPTRLIQQRLNDTTLTAAITAFIIK